MMILWAGVSDHDLWRGTCLVFWSPSASPCHCAHHCRSILQQSYRRSQFFLLALSMRVWSEYVLYVEFYGVLGGRSLPPGRQEKNQHRKWPQLASWHPMTFAPPPSPPWSQARYEAWQLLATPQHQSRAWWSWWRFDFFSSLMIGDQELAFINK